MVYNCVLRQWPADLFRVFNEGGNLMPTTVFVLVSAIQKIARVTALPATPPPSIFFLHSSAG